MPTKLPSVCTKTGCSGLVTEGVCSKCGPRKRATNAAHDDQRGSARRRGYDVRWEKVRAMHLRAEPLCRICAAQGRVTVATLVDHVQPIADGGERLDDDNLQSLCARCHAKKTAEDVRKRKQTGAPGRGG